MWPALVLQRFPTKLNNLLPYFQEVNEMKELLNSVPWDMPKLRKKTQQLFTPGGETGFAQPSRPVSMPASVRSAANSAFLLQPPSKNNSANSSNEGLPLALAPPPGFGDPPEPSEEFYLKEGQGGDSSETAEDSPAPVRMRPGTCKMTKVQLYFSEDRLES